MQTKVYSVLEFEEVKEYCVYIPKSSLIGERKLVGWIKKVPEFGGEWSFCLNAEYSKMNLHLNHRTLEDLLLFIKNLVNDEWKEEMGK